MAWYWVDEGEDRRTVNWVVSLQCNVMNMFRGTRMITPQSQVFIKIT